MCTILAAEEKIRLGRCRGLAATGGGDAQCCIAARKQTLKKEGLHPKVKGKWKKGEIKKKGKFGEWRERTSAFVFPGPVWEKNFTVETPRTTAPRNSEALRSRIRPKNS